MPRGAGVGTDKGQSPRDPGMVPSQATPPVTGRSMPPPPGHKGKLRPGAGPGQAGTSVLSLGLMWGGLGGRRGQRGRGGSSWGLWPSQAQGLVAKPRTRAHVCVRVCVCACTRGTVLPHRHLSGPVSGPRAGCPLSSGGSPARPPGALTGQRARGPTHFIFSARCSVFSRMAWDSWDTGFSIRLSKITCEDLASARRLDAPGSPVPSTP